MKKFFATLLVLALTVVLCLSFMGCGNESSETQKDNLPPINRENANKKLNAYIPLKNSESQENGAPQFINSININNKYHFYYFYLGDIAEVPVYHSTYIKYTGIDFKLGFEFQELKSETLRNNISEATEVIDTHSYTGGFKLSFTQNFSVPFRIVRGSFTSNESTDHHWTNNWGSTVTNSISTEEALLKQYSKTVTLNFDISEESGLKEGYCYRIAYYSPVHAFGVIAYDVEENEYATTTDVIVSDNLGLMVEESENTLFNYDKSQKIIFDADAALAYAKNNPLEETADTITPPVDIGNNKEFAGGFGTEESPYLISSVDHLSNIKNYSDKNFRIIKDISINAESFRSIPEFKGTINGDECKLTFNGIRKVNFARIGDGQYGGLFDNNYGTIKNLTVKNIDFQSKEFWHTDTYKIAMGGIVGFNHKGGNISNVVIEGNFICDRNNSAFGTICGINNGTITNCKAEAVIYGTGDCGGIVGFLENGTIDNCTFIGNIAIYIANDNGNQTLRSWGGIVGYSTNSIISNCYVDKVAFEYRGENNIYHNNSFLGIHINCNLQIRVGVVCGMFVESENGSYSNCEFDLEKCPLKLNFTAGKFHNGSHEKKYLFANLQGAIGCKQ